jgi:hypothetical protein
VIRLDEEAALDATRVGDKAARLARAARADLPVADGWVVPFDACEPALRHGRDALRSSGRAAATLAVSATTEPSDSAAHVSWNRSVVRSSTMLDRDGRWAGAFASYLDVTRDVLDVAVHGCIASAFSRDVLERCEATGTAVDELAIGALIQPWIEMDAGGTATVRPDGTVSVAAGVDATRVVATGAAARWLVTADGGAVPAEPGAEDLVGGAEAIRAAAGLARSVADRLGDRSIEWAWRDGRCTLLQSRGYVQRERSDRPVASVRSRPSLTAPERRRRTHLAEVATRYPGPLGDELVMPWAAAGIAVPDRTPLVTVDPAATLDEVVERRNLLAQLAWKGSGFGADEALGSLLAGSTRALSWVPPAGSIDAETAAMMGRLDGLADWVVAHGIVTDPRSIWRWTVDQLRGALHGSAPPPADRHARWEPLAASILLEDGSVAIGHGVADGIGAGRVHALGRPGAGRPGPRSILAVGTPLPQVAPMLWRCAGLVVARGSEGAHLYEVASSLGVPAVSGVDLRGSHGGSAAVDGTSGLVATPMTTEAVPAGRRKG